jgi:16S rRNA C1402 (ribose-2'-O) methylase RsmI
MIEVKQLMKGTVFVFFESPHRIMDALALLQEIAPESRLSISREMKKV